MQLCTSVGLGALLRTTLGCKAAFDDANPFVFRDVPI